MTEESTPGVPPNDGMADPTRRQFFRRFAGEVVTSAAQVVTVVTDLRDRSAAEAVQLLDPAGAAMKPAATSIVHLGGKRILNLLTFDCRCIRRRQSNLNWPISEWDRKQPLPRRNKT